MSQSLYRKDNMALIDNLKAFAIAFCAAHLPAGSLFPALSGFGDILSTAALPMFVVISAYFMKADIVRNSTDFVEKVFSMLMLSSAICFVYAWVGNRLGVFDRPMPLVSNAGQFYLVLLIFWKVITPYMLNLRPWIMWGAVALLLLGPMALRARGYVFPDLVYAAGVYTPFYFLGLLLTWPRIVAMRDSPRKHWILPVAVPVLVVAYAAAVMGWMGESYPLSVLYRMIVAPVVILLAFLYFPGYKIPVFHRIGSKCLVIYLFHVLIMTWPYGHAIYPHLKEHLAQPYIGFVTFGVYLFTFYVLSFDAVFKAFVNATNFTRRILFRG